MTKLITGTISVSSVDVNHPEGWFATLKRRFKPHATTATVQLQQATYFWIDVRHARPASAWAQNFLRMAQAAGFGDTTQQLRMIWVKIDPAVQRDIPEPTETTTVDNFMQQLDRRYSQWLGMSVARENFPDGQSYQQSPPARQAAKDLPTAEEPWKGGIEDKAYIRSIPSWAQHRQYIYPAGFGASDFIATDI
ncbi:hypothetical protein N7471_001055 [Penicillium samsonianum]|uniref:uncharacterized protein n=1 Tax=Penicillium samsonianum TaxID=1882272 RepID=UPI0025494B1B|nr:uncharacterized protein N7471_001055 [Penicillium samsonianum]KAJ6149856.1 hypothetical protein N7471_001055 [Penicillium samsonianum]